MVPDPPAEPKVVAKPLVLSSDSEWESDASNSLRRFTFYFALCAIFIRFSVIHEVIKSLIHVQIYLLYFFMPPAALGAFATGGLRRIFRTRTGLYWLIFLLCLCLSVPFSVWKGDSVNVVYKYAKADYIMLIVVGGLVMTWKECKLTMLTLALAAITDLAVGTIFMREGTDRSDLDLGSSTISNSNDMAVHLILMMGFLLYLILLPKMPTILKLACFPGIGYGALLILRSGSRGALIAVVVCAVFSFVMGSGTFRAASIVALPVLAIVIVSTLPRATLMRLATLTSDASDVDVQGDAEGSSDLRRELLKKSLVYTMQNPLFGVGPGQFSNAEGGESMRAGKTGLWHATHNTFTQISSECGIPAAGFFIAAIVSAFLSMLRTNRQARRNPGNQDIAAASFCVMFGMVGFFTAVTFANFAYFFYEPALCGLCAVIAISAKREMAARKLVTAATPLPRPLWAPAQPLVAPAPSFASKLR